MLILEKQNKHESSIKAYYDHFGNSNSKHLEKTFEHIHVLYSLSSII